MNTLNVVAVLKSGGVYNEDYVKNLHYRLIANLTNISFRFVLLTDMKVKYCNGCTIPLVDDLPGWWSKIELFKLSGPCLYLDLDTTILSDITDLAKEVLSQEKDCFYMLEDFNGKEFASGIMAWVGDWSTIHTSFDRKDIGIHKWDQRYISNLLKGKTRVKVIQDIQKGIYSYKYHCRGGVPGDASIICFHGKPKPHEVGGVFFVT